MFTPSTGDGRARSEGTLFRPRVMNKLQRRPTRLEHPAATSTRPHGGYQRGAWAGCFSLLVSPAADSYWADCLRYMCSVEQRSDYRTSKANGQRDGSVALVLSQPHLPNVMSTVRGGGNKPHAVLSFISWEQRHRDLRGVLAQALHAHAHFADGYILNAIENDASEEMGEPLLWYPVAHLTREYHQGAMYPRDGRRHDRKVLGNHFTLLQDTYYEHTKLTLILDKGRNGGGGGGKGDRIRGGGSGGGGGKVSPAPPMTPPRYSRNLLVLAYKSLEDSTDPGLLAGWVRWSGAWEAYSLLQERKLPVSSITLDLPPSFLFSPLS
ncbi:uncharacterized protein LOC127007283 isoform X2 [Eriocheir sinensis]|uniref:uncharacterized protein LOC127007283 isoform X2 n=1 Tax=Eriocheir sinensis TaxID=95602 RepID=UPI0021C64A5E|nr:uncharacterized protein LOC127007283 isoform X2 [Eriocheir sinensis]